MKSTKSNNSPIRILIVDDSLLIRTVLRSLIESKKDLQVIGEASNEAEAIEQARLLRPDVVTMDIEMPMMNGIDACKEIYDEHADNIRVIMVTAHPLYSPLGILESKKNGAVDFLEKQSIKLNSLQVEIDQLLDKVRFWGYKKPKPAAAHLASSAAKIQAAESKKPVLRRASFGKVDALIIGASTGGTVQILELLDSLCPVNIPIIIALHAKEDLSDEYRGCLSEYLQSRSSVAVASVSHVIAPREVVILPAMPTLHLVRNDDLVHFKKSKYTKSGIQPNISDIFQSALVVFQCPMALILSGLGNDGSSGIKNYSTHRAPVLTLDPDTVAINSMPKAAIASGCVDYYGAMEAVIHKIQILTSGKEMRNE